MLVNTVVYKYHLRRFYATPFYANHPSQPIIHISTCVPLVSSTVVDFSYINQLLSESTCNLIWYPLAHESLVCSLDGVHLVARSWYLGRKILDTNASCHFEDVVLSTAAKSCRTLVFPDTHIDENIPGGLAINLTSAADTFPSTSP